MGAQVPRPDDHHEHDDADHEQRCSAERQAEQSDPEIAHRIVQIPCLRPTEGPADGGRASVRLRTTIFSMIGVIEAGIVGATALGMTS